MVSEKTSALIIDDALTVRQSLRAILSQLGITRAETASTIGEARRRINSTQFDVILCDYHFGDGTSGQEFLEELRRDGKLSLSTVFFMITAESTYERVVAVAEVAPDDYLLKPFTSAQLHDRLVRAENKKQVLLTIYNKIERGDLPGAINAAKELLDVTKTYRTDVIRLLAHLLMETGRVNEAGELYSSLLSTRTVPWAKLGLARVFGAKGQGEQAEALMKSIIADNHMYVDAYDQLATHFITQGREDEAMAVMEKALAVTPHNLARLQQAGQIAYRLGEHGKARGFLERAVAHGGNSNLLDPRAVMYLAISCYAEGKQREAEKMVHLLTGLAEREPSYERRMLLVLSNAARAWAIGKPDQAVFVLKEIGNHILTPELTFELAVDFLSVCARMASGETAVLDWANFIVKRFAVARAASEKMEIAVKQSKELTGVVQFISQEINQLASQGAMLVVQHKLSEAADHLYTHAIETWNARLLLAAANACLRCAKADLEDSYRLGHAEKCVEILVAQRYEPETVDQLITELRAVRDQIQRKDQNTPPTA
ncbi:CheY-like chemotaxis protein [Chitinivorax tropicus]|uniref:CheY-like chemotaxis protein n=1 Tax=Chitinivorax tropicus TaxID=714531 RepID=A0A840MM28_9PROT|nr:response regulator [Chitinivorax tropicus]MBB5018535.1 CheY-like chemotaxis protein [Chitinivorax tropicus]